MALCSYSSGLAMDGYTVIENTFFNEFLPQSTGDDVKVYLYGLSLCTNPNSSDNDIDAISRVLSLTEDQVKRAFLYWQEMGLVQVVSKEPFEVRYLPVHMYSGSAKIRKPEKYTEFNKAMQNILTGREITPNEYNQYYTLIESKHFEPEAVILIASYCVRYKSNDAVSYPYILSVARNFDSEGLRTYDAIEQKIIEQEKSGSEIKQVLKALGISRNADLDERNLYIKWTQKYGFTHGVIVKIAKMQNKRGGFAKLDETLSKFYEQKLFSLEEIADFSEKQDELFTTAKEVCKILGIYYQNYDSVVSNYVSDWNNKGYEKDALLFTANYCFKQSLRTLEGMNVVVQKFFKIGLISTRAIEQYIESILENDEKIREIIDALGLLRTISSSDRELYKTWTQSWNFEHEHILLVSQMIKDKSNQMTYLSRVLSDLHERHIQTESEIEKYLKSYNGSGAKKQKEASSEYLTRELSKEQLSAVIDSLDEVEI